MLIVPLIALFASLAVHVGCLLYDRCEGGLQKTYNLILIILNT